MNAAGRVAALRARLQGESIEALVLNDVANVRYVTAFENVFDDDPAHVAVITRQTQRLFTDPRYAEAARDRAEGSGWEVVVVSGPLFSQVCEVLSRSKVSSLGFETSLSYGKYLSLTEGFDGTCTPVSNWVEEERAVKDAAELARIVSAQAIADDAFDHILGFVRPGMTETQVALELEFFMRSRGSEGVAFDAIVASGPNSALPHAHPGGREILRGDLLKMDFGARVGGYCSDMTRTVVVGKASARQREVYETVLAANLAGIDAVRAGRPGSEIDAAARAVVESGGFGECFRHGLGHGVGLEVHELPSLGSRSTWAVPLGSVVTVEPGIYIPGFGGVRIEDLVTVEAAGARVLTRSTKELIEL